MVVLETMKHAGPAAVAIAMAIVMCTCLASCSPAGASTQQTTQQGEEALLNKDRTDMNTKPAGYDMGAIPEELERIPDGYRTPAAHAGALEKLVYQTYDSFNYGAKGHELEKTAWVYVPYGYDVAQRYDVFYLSHGGWSDETTQLGTASNPSALKHVLDHAIEGGLIAPVIVVCPTYNNLNGDDSWDYSLALQLTANFHNELANDLIPAVESKYSTYAEDVTPEGLKASRAHRAFGGFSMGSVNTWHAFENCLDYFSMFMPMSGGAGWTGTQMEDIVHAQGIAPDDFFIYGMSGTDDFAYPSFCQQVLRLAREAPETFTQADGLSAGNVAFRVREGSEHNQVACDEYTYNGMRLFFNGARTAEAEAAGEGEAARDSLGAKAAFTRDTPIDEVMGDPAFGSWGRLLFPVQRSYQSGNTLGKLSLTWYNYIDPDMTVEVCNYLHARAAGKTVFIDIYTDAEKTADSAKADTGLLFFQGDVGARTAIVNAGGGFSYVGAMHDSFPHCLELSKRGYNAFALIYRPGSRTACEDLARAIAYLHDHADELGISMDGYSLWGGSAGARMAAWLGTYGTESFGEQAYPRPAACIVNYTGLSEVTGSEPPTYSAVGTSDWIADWRTMQARIERIRANGTDAEIEVFDGLPHGFGLGIGTAAEGWLDRAVSFWERQL